MSYPLPPTDSHAQVSVVIPVYNAAPFLARCLDGVLSQTLQELEVICVDDGSTDGSAAVLANYAAKDSRVRVITFTENRGAGAARNAGIAAATGEYLGFVDADDLIDAEFYQRLYEAVAGERGDCAKGTILLRDDATGAVRSEAWLELNEWVRRDPAYFVFTFTSAIFRRDLIRAKDVRFLEGRVYFEDSYFTIMAALFLRSVKVVDAARYYYSENRQSSSRRITTRHIFDFCQGARDILALFERYPSASVNYLAAFDFIIVQLRKWCEHPLLEGAVRKTAFSTYAWMLKTCRHLDAWVDFHFTYVAEVQRLGLARRLRARIVGAGKEPKVGL